MPGARLWGTSCEAYLATVDKVFTFDSDLEGLVDDGSSAKLTVAWNGSEGSPSAGNMLFTYTGTGGSTEEEIAKTPATGWDLGSVGGATGRGRHERPVRWREEEADSCHVC